MAADATGLRFDPQLPDGWTSLAFSVQWQRRHVSVSIDNATRSLVATLSMGEPMTITIGDGPLHFSLDGPVVATFTTARGRECAAIQS